MGRGRARGSAPPPALRALLSAGGPPVPAALPARARPHKLSPALSRGRRGGRAEEERAEGDKRARRGHTPSCCLLGMCARRARAEPAFYSSPRLGAPPPGGGQPMRTPGAPSAPSPRRRASPPPQPGFVVPSRARRGAPGSPPPAVAPCSPPGRLRLGWPLRGRQRPLGPSLALGARGPPFKGTRRPTDHPVPSCSAWEPCIA